MEGPCSPPFVVPLSLRDLEIVPRDDEYRIFAQKVIDVDALQPDEVEQLVKGLAFDLADKEVLCIEEQEIFDQVYSLVRGFSSLDPAMKGCLVESLRLNFSTLLPSISSLLTSAQDSTDDVSSGNRIYSYRNAFRIYSYFIQSIVFTQEAEASAAKEKPTVRTAGKSKQPRKKHLPKPWDWDLQRAKVLRLLATAFDEDLRQLFGTSQPEETLFAYLLKGAFSLLEDPVVVKNNDVKEAIYNLIASCSTKYRYVTQATASMLHLLHKHDHLPVYLAEAVAYAEQKYHDSSLAVALIREIGRFNPRDFARDGLGAENIGKFLVELTERLPKIVATNVGILMPHFGGESYKIRSALISLLGKLVSKAYKEADGSNSNEVSRLRSKQAVIDVLMERSRDVSAYTRSRVLQTWVELCENHDVSIGLWNQVADLAAGRLKDKAALVRKSALQLVSTLLQHNPFGPQLRTSAFEATLNKYKAQLENMSSQSHADSSVEEVGINKKLVPDDGTDLFQQLHVSENAAEVGPSVLDESTFEDSGFSQNLEPVQHCVRTSDVGGLEQTRALVASLEAGLCFTKCVASTMPVLVQLLSSSNASDVEHAIQLLMCARQFNIDGAESCLRKMLPLVFSQEKAIHDAVESAFFTIYVKKNSFETAMNLINLTLEASIGDLTSMEQIMFSLVKKGDISNNIISSLWDFFTFNAPGATADQSRGALIVLSMVAKASPNILDSHIQNIVDIGFGRWAKEDALLARTACKIIQNLSETGFSAMLSNHKIFSNLENVIMMSTLPEESWYGTAEQAVNAIYMLHPTPEVFASCVLQKFYASAFPANCEPVNDSSNTDNQISVTSLSRFLFLVGHIALRQFVYIESCVRKARKHRNDKERSATEGQENIAAKEENISTELGIAASMDAKIDALQERAEKDIISWDQSRKYLIGACAPLVAKVARNFNLMQEFPVLQSSTMLALCKLMVIDAAFCEENLQLLFTVAQNATQDTVRSNCIIALGDLTSRFPNLLEPWTEHVYARLRDGSPPVRKNAVLVLSHLILNDMMKVKGHITEMTLRLEDEDPGISNLVKLFFHELSKKGNNPIYNLLPDILSRLSDMKDLQQKTFKNIMQLLIGSIKKEKQMEGLIEKLCHRFLGNTDPKQWQNIAYCLSLLTYSEKGMRKLADLIKSYQHTLGVDEVVNHFKTIISKAKKFAKPDVRVAIEEFEQKIIEFHEERKDQEATMENARSHVAAQMRTEEIFASKDVSTTSTCTEDKEDVDQNEGGIANLDEKAASERSSPSSDSSVDCSEVSGGSCCNSNAPASGTITEETSEEQSVGQCGKEITPDEASCVNDDDKETDDDDFQSPPAARTTRRSTTNKVEKPNARSRTKRRAK